ncbi:cyclin-like protein [Mrakia frigida]|uniref:transcription factor SUA7 n=1 Tax=Mrakia frigida TaxID=29902 RepID=UPI003FCC20ED
MAFVQPFPLSRNPTAAPLLKAGPKAPVSPITGPDLAVHLSCPECAPLKPEIIEEFGSGDLVCGGCGLVLGDKIVDTRSEWRTFANDEGDDPSRVGAANNPLDGPESFETGISFRDGNTGLSRELQRASHKAFTKTEKSLANAYTEIAATCDKVSLGKQITDTAKQLYKRATEEGVLKGKPQDAIIAACIFIACRLAKSPRTFKEICTLTQVPKKILAACYRQLERAFDEVKANGGQSIGSPSSNPTPLPPPSMLPRFISNLGFSVVPGFQSACIHVLIAGKALGLIDGRSPLTVVGSLLYFMCHLWGVPKTAKQICQVVDTTEGTIRGRYKVLVEKKDFLIKREWLESGKAKLERLPH